MKKLKVFSVVAAASAILSSGFATASAGSVYMYCVNQEDSSDRHYVPEKYLQSNIQFLDSSIIEYQMSNNPIRVNRYGARTQYASSSEIQLSSYDSTDEVFGPFANWKKKYRQSVNTVNMSESTYNRLMNGCEGEFGKEGVKHIVQGYDARFRQWYLTATKPSWTENQEPSKLEELKRGFVNPWFSNGVWWVDSGELNIFNPNSLNK